MRDAANLHPTGSPPLSLPVAVALTALSGVAYGLSFPPSSLRLLAWVALVPWLVAVRRSSLLRAALLGALWAHVETFMTSDCLPGAIESYYQQHPVVGWVALELATLITMVPYYGAFAASYWLLSRSLAPGLLAIVAACAWVGAELARVKLLGGNPWALSGYSQVGLLPIMQIADVAGVHGISFCLALVNAALTEVIVGLGRGAARSRALRSAVQGLAIAGVVVCAVLLYGAWRLRERFEDDRRPATQIAVIQPNLPMNAHWREDRYGENLDTYLMTTLEAAEKDHPAIVFWPESAMTFFLSDEPSYRRAIGGVLSRFGAELVAGGPRVEEGKGADDALYFNSTFLLSPQGEATGWQDKTVLLPFAEYFPLATDRLLRRDFGRAQQFAPGEQRPALPTVAGGAGAIVCNEAMFPEVASDRVRAGAGYLVNPANDSWFASLKYSLQAFDIARLRAVEQRRYLVRASTAGPSAIVDPLGRVTVETQPFTRAWIAGTIRASHATTLYQRVGDLFAAVCSLLALLAIGWSLLGGRGLQGKREVRFAGDRDRDGRHS